MAGEPSLGDQVSIPGLFWHRPGELRNLSILRSGIVSALPTEPLEDLATGLPYEAYLIGARSTGGQSGSPVLSSRKKFNAIDVGSTSYAIMGLIRGHFSDVSPYASADSAGDRQVEMVNTGIATVTPVQKILGLLFDPTEVSARNKA